jgi:tripartite ATP-independent transporter DctM subunit
MNVGLMTLILFSSLIIFLFLGLPLVFSLGGIAIVGLVTMMGTRAIPIIYWNTLSVASNPFFITVPLFIYMAYMLERSGAAEELYKTIQNLAGHVSGSLAMATVFVSTILAAMTGLSSASIITMGVTVLPSMLRRGYNKHLAMGSITAGSTLGILIPPSAIALLYTSMAGISVGRMFLAGFFPGFLLAGLFILYIGIRCALNPSLGPKRPSGETVERVSIIGSLWSVALPGLLVILVLGSIFLGIATPTESAALGALGAIGVVAFNRRLTWKTFREVNYRTMLLTLMIMWVIIAAGCFRALYIVTGAIDLIENMLLAVPFGRWGTLIVMQITLLVLGCFLDEFGIMIIALGVFIPVAQTLGFNPIWFGILFIINMEMAELTPPVGLNLFYMKAVAPEGTSMGDIYKSVIPFILILLLGLILVMVFPQIALWLPSQMIR